MIESIYWRFILWISSSSLLVSFPLDLEAALMDFSLPRECFFFSEPSSAPLIISGVFSHTPFIYQCFYFIFQLDAVIRVMTMTLIETTVLGLICPGRFLD